MKLKIYFIRFYSKNKLWETSSKNNTILKLNLLNFLALIIFLDLHIIHHNHKVFS